MPLDQQTMQAYLDLQEQNKKRLQNAKMQMELNNVTPDQEYDTNTMQNQNNLIAGLLASANQAGAIGGKVASAAPVTGFAQNINSQIASGIQDKQANKKLAEAEAKDASKEYLASSEQVQKAQEYNRPLTDLEKTALIAGLNKNEGLKGKVTPEMVANLTFGDVNKNDLFKNALAIGNGLQTYKVNDMENGIPVTHIVNRKTGETINTYQTPRIDPRTKDYFGRGGVQTIASEGKVSGGMQYPTGDYDAQEKLDIVNNPNINPMQRDILLKEKEQSQQRREKQTTELSEALNKTGIPKMETQLNFIEENLPKKGDVPGYGPVVGKMPDLFVSKQGKQLRQDIQTLFDIELKDRSGAAVTDQELERLKREFGAGGWQTADQVRRGIERYKARLIEVKRNLLAGYNPEAKEQYVKQGGNEQLVTPPAPYQPPANPQSQPSSGPVDYRELLKKKNGGT